MIVTAPYVAPLAFFLPLPIPQKTKIRVAPPRDIATISAPDDCTPDRLGDGVSSQDCRDLLTDGAGFVLRFDWHQRPCDTGACAYANNFEYSLRGGPVTRLWPAPHDPGSEGRHSLAVHFAGPQETCLDLTAVHLPDANRSATTHVCVRIAPPPAATR